MWKIRLGAFALILMAGTIAAFVYFSETKPASFVGKFPFVLGLDLKGGAHLVYRADTSKLASADVASSMESLRNVIERRVNLFGVSEPLVQVERKGLLAGSPEERLIVELPGITDLDQAISMIGATPILEFRLLKKGVSLESLQDEETIRNSFEETGLTGRYLAKASLEFDSTSNEPLVSLRFNDEGKNLFANITRDNVGRTLAIFLDGKAISMPVIREAIPSGEAQIFGRFTPEEGRTLVRDLNYGSLPVPIELVSTQTIGASLGEEATARSVYAGIIGSTLIALFLVLWYRLPGLLAVIALFFYVSLNLALFKFIPVTLTAAGLAAFILSIGMAVDANILIFERLKEELRAGRLLNDAVREGFARAWLSIRDSNLSSIITAAILFWMGGTPIIKGFALVFVIGVLVSMFTAITVTRTLLFSLGLGLRKNEGVVRFLFGNGFSNN